MQRGAAITRTRAARRSDASARKFSTYAFIALSVVAVVALAACGGSSGSSSSKKPTASTATRTAMVATAKNSKLGTILVDDKGMTLYTLTNAGQPVPCSDACLTVWPPLLLPSGTTKATGSAGVRGLGTVAAGGNEEVTVNGSPLYHFTGDHAAGDVNGDGINSFGGTWHVVVSSGGPTSPSTTPSTRGGSGY